MRASGVRFPIRPFAARFSTRAAAADLPAAAAPTTPPPLSTVWSRFYLSLHGGVGLLQGTSLDYINGALPSRSVDFNPGWTVVGAAGFQVTPWWRTEVEVGGRRNGVSHIIPGDGHGGSVQATTFMFNGYLDLPNRRPSTPH